MDNRENIIKKIKEVPAFPTNSFHILNKINEPEAHVLDIARELKRTQF
jgi:hypothetical protein